MGVKHLSFMRKEKKDRVGRQGDDQERKCRPRRKSWNRERTGKGTIPAQWPPTLSAHALGTFLLSRCQLEKPQSPRNTNTEN